MARLIIALALISLLAGCTRHYRESMVAYRATEPTSFAARTLDWVETAESAPALEPEPAADVTGAFAVDAGEKRNVQHDLMAEFFQLTPEALAERTARVSSPQQVLERLSPRFAWEDLALAVALHNPAVRAASERWRAELRKYDQAAYLDGLINQFRTFTRYLEVGPGKSLHRSMVQSFLPYPGTIAVQGELIAAQARAAELAWQKVLRDQVVGAGEAFYEYQYHQRAHSTASENVELIESLLEVVEERYRTGSATQADLLRVQTELERQRDVQLDHQGRTRSAGAEMKALVGLGAPWAIGPPDDADERDFAPAFDKLLSVAMSSRQEVRIQDAAIERSEASIRLGELMNRPLATQGYSLNERGMAPEASAGEPRGPAGLMRKFPDRPEYAQAEAYLAESRLRLESLLADRDQIGEQTAAMAREIAEELDIARRHSRLVLDIVLPQTDLAFETTLSGYISGNVSFLDLLDAERELIRARLELHDARRALNKTYVRLPRLTGVMLAP